MKTELEISKLLLDKFNIEKILEAGKYSIAIYSNDEWVYDRVIITDQKICKKFIEDTLGLKILEVREAGYNIIKDKSFCTRFIEFIFGK